MSQIQPQASKVNQKTFLKVEKYGRSIAVKLGYVNSVTITNYKNARKTIKNNVIIPSGFYRIYYNDEKDFKKCFYYKNDIYVNHKKDKLKDHIVDCSEVYL
jgi:endonuclease G